MGSPTAWFARNPVPSNLLMLAVLVAGGLGLVRVVYEVFPAIEPPIVTVTVPYRGATPAEVEEGVCLRVEEALDGVTGIERLTATANEGVGLVVVELEDGEDVREKLDEIKNRVDAIETFPPETEKPIVQELEIRSPVIQVAVSGEVELAVLDAWARRVRDRLLESPEITRIEISGAPPPEISIEVSELALRRFGLSFDEVARAVQRGSVDLPGGSIDTPSGEVLLRTSGEAATAREYEALTLRARPDGARVALRDVATVVDGWAETDQAARFDGTPAVMVEVFRVGDQSALAIARRVDGILEELRAELPPALRLDTFWDDTVMLRDRLDMLVRNGRAGLLLVFVLLALFLRLRLALWVSLGIVVSFAGALAFMPALDATINTISLFAFVLVLGIVVDDAIVVAENIHARRQAGDPPLEAAVRGVAEVTRPVTFSILTTVAAFGALMFLPTTMATIPRLISSLVVLTLAFSLLESLLILPSHLAHQRRTNAPSRRSVLARWARLQDRFHALLERGVDRIYRPLLQRAIEWRYLTVAIALAVFLLNLGIPASGLLRFRFFPDIETDYVVALATLPQGASRKATEEVLARLERSAARLGEELAAEGRQRPIRHVRTVLGEHPFRERQRSIQGQGTLGPARTHLGEVMLELAPAAERDVSSATIAGRWRDLTGPLPEVEEVAFDTSFFAAGAPIEVRLAGADLERLRQASAELQAALAAYPGVADVADTYHLGKRELRLDLTPEGEAAGLRRADLARQVRAGFYGLEAQRIQRGRDDVRVMVRYTAEERRSQGSLDELRIRRPDGGEVPFARVGRATLGRGAATIERADRRRVVSVTADVDAEVTSTAEVLGDLEKSAFPELLARHPGVTVSLEGEERERREMTAALGRNFVVSLLVIYALLAIPLRSYLQPLLIMSAIPFGLVGATLGHLAMGLDVTMLSNFGVIALTGVVVNDSLVLVDFIRRGRERGEDLDRAIRAAGVARFRAVVLTSLTTFAGLTPLLLERSVQAQFVMPMAATLAFGVAFATLVTLLLVPALYRIGADLRGR
jgi:multidrug efflux pump subunit AcrB